jgi:hypothetical protein
MSIKKIVVPGTTLNIVQTNEDFVVPNTFPRPDVIIATKSGITITMPDVKDVGTSMKIVADTRHRVHVKNHQIMGEIGSDRLLPRNRRVRSGGIPVFGGSAQTFTSTPNNGWIQDNPLQTPIQVVPSTPFHDPRHPFEPIGAEPFNVTLGDIPTSLPNLITAAIPSSLLVIDVSFQASSIAPGATFVLVELLVDGASMVPPQIIKVSYPREYSIPLSPTTIPATSVSGVLEATLGLGSGLHTFGVKITGSTGAPNDSQVKGLLQVTRIG